jgi:plastocyanin
MEDLMIGATFYYFWTDADIHNVAGDQTSAVRSDELGWEIDTTVTYSYTEDVTFGLMANWFVPGEYYNAPNDETAMEMVSSVKVTF